MAKHLLLVALGGGVGSALRYLTSLWTFSHYTGGFPLGTFIVNIVGCLLIGILTGLAGHYTLFDNHLRYLLIVGFCGGYTTFSTFSAENLALFETGSYGMLALNVTTSVVLGMAAVWGGIFLTRLALQ